MFAFALARSRNSLRTTHSISVYTYIGEQVVVMNPYQRLPIYGKEVMEQYRNKYLYEVQPHVYALGDDTFRSLRQRKRDQCVIVTGESGAGKTEAAKQFMEYLTFVCAGGGDAEIIKKKLLDSNPVLEAFGNAKTQRNDNSSRFGKYMEIQFDGAGKPLGGAIRQYLLEKSRVVDRAEDERSFHIFYLMLTDEKAMAEVGIKADPNAYNYLTCSRCMTVEKKNEKAEWKEVTMAMDSLGFSKDNKNTVWQVLGGVLNLGNLEFVPREPREGDPKGVEMSKIGNPEVAETVGKLLGLHPDLLEKCLTQRSITTGAGRRNTSISIFHGVKAAQATRDSLAKALYNAIFSYVTSQTNKAIVTRGTGHTEAVVGILDIYGFEIFDHNSFEQFCINYCNEKLQQLFIKLVLRTEQEEYLREGIEWTEVEYFDNAPIVNLLDGKGGLYKLLDEACTMGNSTPESLLDKFNQHVVSDRYSSDELDRKAHIATGAFRVAHYAGAVDYDVDLFLIKNMDTLYQDVCSLVNSSSMPSAEEILFAHFPLLKAGDRRKRPKTAGKMFVEDLSVLVDTLEKCQPHYIRCIKPNDKKQIFGLNEERTRHQVRYLNVVETVRVRKAGFCNRQPYPRFFPRYKPLFEGKWFEHAEDPRQGTINLFTELKLDAEEFRTGKTQIFIRNVQTLMKLEELRAANLPRVAIGVTRRWRGYKERVKHPKRVAIWRIQRLWRGVLARRRVARVRAAATLRRAVRVYVARQEKARLWKAELARRLLALQHKSALRIQTVVRGRLARNWMAAHRLVMKMAMEERVLEQKRQDAATKIQRFYKRHLVLSYVKLCVKAFCGLPKSTPKFGKDIPWPKAVGQKSRENFSVFKKIRKHFWAYQMIQYWNALVVIQKAYRVRLARSYTKNLATTFTLKKPLGNDKNGFGLYVEAKFGKDIELPRAITARSKEAEPFLIKMKMAWWAYQLIRWKRAMEKLQRRYRERLMKLYVKALSAAVAAEMPKNFSKKAVFPRPIAPGCKEAHASFVKMHHAFWGHKKIMSLGKDSGKTNQGARYARVKQKIIGLTMFRGMTGWSAPYGYDFNAWKLNKPWNCERSWDAEYLKDGQANSEKYNEVVRTLYSEFGDTETLFSDNIIKVNRHGKNQLQTIIVTNKNIYKYNPKTVKIIKIAIPLSECTKISMSPHNDSFVILEFNPPYRDMVLNAGNNGHERTSELATAVWELVHQLTDRWIPVQFVPSLKYNNSREKEKEGIDMTLTWQPATEKDKIKPEEHGNCLWKKGPEKGTALIVYTS